MFLDRYGLILGLVLLAIVFGCAWLLACRAARSVSQFREDHHEHFKGER